MSSKRGSESRSRPQRYQNRTSFRNNLHDTSHTTKSINSLNICEVCSHCKAIIEWKIKYKKYKPLTQPKKCNRCFEKSVRHAYHQMCLPCSRKLKLCPKCCQPEEVVPKVLTADEQIRLDSEMQQALKSLPERKRRTFMRYMNSTRKDPDGTTDSGPLMKTKDELIAKLEELKLQTDRNKDSDDFSDNEDDSPQTNSDSDIE